MAEQQPINRDVSQAQSISLRDDEIDITALIARVWQRKWWVAGITALAVGLAVAYLLVAKPVYRAEIHLMPPSTSDLQALNLETPDIVNQVTSDDAYKAVLNQLRSKRQMLEFFNEAGVKEIYRTSPGQGDQAVFEAFEKALIVNLPKKGDLVFTSVSLDGPAIDQVAESLNSYIDRVRANVISSLVADLYEIRDRKLELLLRDIETRRKSARLKRDDRIKQLEEAFAVASVVGIRKLGPNGSTAVAGQNINIVNSDTLFMRGTEALSAEIGVLKRRVSDDSFTPSLRYLQERVENLRAIRVDVLELTPVHLDMKAVTPDKPIKPKKILVLTISLLLGGMIGLLLALVVPVKNKRQLDRE